MLTLYVDTARWQRHQKAVLAELPGLVPVSKGNGYGFGVARLAVEAAALGADTLAVGTLAEVPTVDTAAFDRVVVLTPWLGDEPRGELPGNVVRTAASVSAVRSLSGQPVIVECRTSLRRHGIVDADLAALGGVLPDVSFEGFALRRPLDRPRGGCPGGEVAAWLERIAAS